jgi:hypothetical protein
VTSWVTDTPGAAVPHSWFYKSVIELMQPLLQSIQALGVTLEIIGNPSDDSSKESLFYESILNKEGWSFPPESAKGEVTLNSAAQYRGPFLYPSGALDDSEFVPRVESGINWASQISSMSAMDQDSF